jgi:hypothetical protein
MIHLQIKRQRNYGANYLQLSTKKSKTKSFILFYSCFFLYRNTINCIENLSNELFFEFFDYLDGCSLYEAFSNLNTRFHHLLNHPSLQLKITLTSKSTPVWEHYSKQFIIPNKHRIISFRFITDTIDRVPLLSWFPVDSTLNRLESLTLTDIKTDELGLLLVKLVSLPRLFSLTIRLSQHSMDIGSTYQLIFKLPKLKYNKLSSNVLNTNISSLKVNGAQCSPIEYLVIDHPCSLSDLITILSHTPHVFHLICKQSLRSTFNIKPIQSTTLFNLTHISIPFRYLSFNEFEIFIKPICSQLRVMKLYTNADPSYLNADRWEKLIVGHIPYLYRFRLTYVDVIRENLPITTHHERINRFTSAFWIKKQWLFDCAIKTWNGQNSALVYRVYPRRYVEDYKFFN